MFDALTDRLTGVFDGLTGRGALSEKDVSNAMREIRVALLEADVALPVVKDFIAKVREEAVGEAVIKSVTPGQMVIKIVHDALIEMLGGEDEDGTAAKLKIDSPPAVIMMAGLQGSGKTTTTGKLAKRLKEKERKKVLLASLDVRRPAAMQQLAILAEQVGVSSLPIVEGQLPVDITKRALQSAKLQGFDVVILDTAGRTTLDEQMMNEADDVAKIAKPQETLLVADALTGQDAVETAKRFHERLPLTGLVLTRMDGDGRGGAALSMRAVTGLPIKFLGVGEKLDGLEVFAAKRVAGRILGRGDIVSLVEKAGEQMDAEKAERLAKKMAKGQFDLDDLAEQLRQLQRMGGLGGIAGMLPGAKKAKQALAGADMDDSVIKRQEAIISSMTKKERAKPALLNASRRKRIAAGAGVEVSDVNKVLKMHKQMSDMMKKMGKGGMKGLMGAMGGMGVSQGDLSKMAARNGGMGGGMPSLGGPGAPGGLPGLGGGTLPGGLPGLPGAKKK
ncbi:signal recognition particle protein [Ponticaulis sp.]|uniref:signal recognition particle protein n=1 Tax=Ponticaulis sp. TaxID=2020902 RepID=UPI000B6C0992|nr:signal recognition particle protein [Ponticaulis sp.]MAJ09345.1 signal recognition particle protein [Ponticaulis sp.]RPG18699.1 MAG: signal recognition particle protein [Hyphomonadaceae bacterium TMED125]HBH90674.1 signal recognition particle protein [Hyphomonadaceae bacterium]HBJ93814.1 signal recognition particle protein [Hyphomonadaceae bacterium]|tara:strand:- start:13585 stop:15096 length:1512 start_codon:yes stop_codon:yes gene_type:complete